MRDNLMDLYDKIAHYFRDPPIIKLLLGVIDDDKILDVGCGDGFLTGRLIESMKTEKGISLQAEGIDVLIPRKTLINVKKYDGVKLPFDNGSFDCVMCIDVLHHVEYPKKLFSELVRVSNRHIIIKDQFYQNFLDLKILKSLDWLGNKPHGVNLPYNFLEINEWKKMFSDFDLSIEYWKLFRLRFFDPTKNFLVKLKKSAPDGI